MPAGRVDPVDALRGNAMMTSGQGAFIVFEGLDGAGTTTQSRLLAERLTREMPGRKVHLTAEPSNGPIGQSIRQILKGRLVGRSVAGPEVPFDRHALALLFAADRLDHLACEIRPLLDEGYLVISDRYVLSSLAYQGMDVAREWVVDINRHAPPPDVQFFLDTPAETGWQRMQGSRPGCDLFEAPDTLRRVAQSYRESLVLCPARHPCILDGTQSREHIADAVWRTLQQLKMVP